MYCTLGQKKLCTLRSPALAKGSYNNMSNTCAQFSQPCYLLWLCLKLVEKYYTFKSAIAIFQHIPCQTYDESQQKQAEPKFLLLLTWIYSVFFALPIPVTQLKYQKTEKLVIHTGLFTKYWKFEQVSLKTGDFEIKRGNGDNLQKGSLPFKTGRLEHVVKWEPKKL